MSTWGDYVYAKVNAVPVFASEKRYGLTRGTLETLAREPYPGCVSILTKSPLVLRDVDLLAALPRAEVGLTVTTTDDRLPRADTIGHRQALDQLVTDILGAHGLTPPAEPRHCRRTTREPSGQLNRTVARVTGPGPSP